MNFECFSDDDLGGVARELLELAPATEDRIAIEEIRDRQPVVETELAGIVIVVGRQNRHTGTTQAVEMPFAEVAGHIARVVEGRGDRLFLTPQCVAVTFDAGAIVGTSGQYAGAGG